MITSNRLQRDASEMAARGDFESLAIAGDLEAAAREIRRLRTIERFGIAWRTAYRKVEALIAEEKTTTEPRPVSEDSMYLIETCSELYWKLAAALDRAKVLRRRSAK